MRASTHAIAALIFTASLTYGGHVVMNDGIENVTLLDQTAPATATPPAATPQPQQCTCEQDHEAMFEMISEESELSAMVFPGEGDFLEF